MNEQRPRARGTGRRGGKGARAGLSVELIVDQTLALIDERGIAEASMRSVADRLGVRPMSLYRHVLNREELFDAVVERIVNELDDDSDVPDRVGEDGWRAYLGGLARGVRRYALAHPHAFPLVATRPPAAPWINPPLRSLRWIESFLTTLQDIGFADDEILFTYRVFNGFLLGSLLLETSARVLDDPKPGDGSFQTGDGTGANDPVDPTDPVPGALSPTRTTADRHAIQNAGTAQELTDPTGDVGRRDYPVINRLQVGLTEDRFEEEFSAGLVAMLDRVDRQLGRGST